jgi:steroid delta-isomerase-like uncharacterized protein
VVADFDRAWTAAWNAHDVEAILGMLDPDIEWIEAGVRRVLRGLGDARRRIEADFRAVPDLHAETLAVFAGDEATGAVHWRLAGTYRDDDHGAPGRPFSFEGVSLWRFRDERVVRLQMIYDVSDLAAQTAPGGARPSRSGRGVNRLTARAREALRR